MTDNIKHLIDNIIKIIMESNNNSVTLIIKHDNDGYIIKYKYTRM